jgi:site-specific DNA recombinase
LRKVKTTGGAYRMTRAVIYARFSTDLQNERSIDDQIALCRAHAQRQGARIVAIYYDSARSGASIFGRDGLAKLMEAARESAFDVVIVEALDRLSRDMEDLAGIHKRLTFLGIEIRAVHDGTADSILVGIRGLMGQLQLQDTAKKVRRGMAGVLRDGRHPGGCAYGYRAVPGKRGVLEIVEHEAKVVQRIFASYVRGETPREIATTLNREGIPPPRGRRWNASTINGNAQRGAGIILNELYAGRIVWNKVRMLKNPDTGRRISRPNPRSEWQSIEAPHLRIVDPGTFATTQQIKAAKAGKRSHQKRRPSHIFSGLLRCGSCGSGMVAYGRADTGRRRARCSAMYESGTCENKRSVYLDTIERLVLDGMREQLRDPRLIEVYVRAYNTEREKAATTASTARSKLESKLASLGVERRRMVDLIVKGVIDEEDGRDRLAAMKAQRGELEAEIAELGEAPKAITLHPATIERYLATVERIADNLASHAADLGTKGTLITDLRALIQSVTVYARQDRRLEIEVKGRLAALIGGRPFPERIVGTRVVAEAGLEPATFGL